MNFESIVKNVLPPNRELKIETRLCPDQYVGVISQFSSHCDFLVRKPVTERPKEVKCVIMILESPHIHEFSNNLGPAKGRTGKLLRDHFLSVDGLSRFGDHGLILVNAIQHQCSLGVPTKRYRDEVFTKAWGNGWKENFVHRLENCYQSGDTVLNCCTKGKKKIELRQLVQRAIPDYAGETLRRFHPCSWFYQKYRDAQW